MCFHCCHSSSSFYSSIIVPGTVFRPFILQLLYWAQYNIRPASSFCCRIIRPCFVFCFARLDALECFFGKNLGTVFHARMIDIPYQLRYIIWIYVYDPPPKHFVALCFGISQPRIPPPFAASTRLQDTGIRARFIFLVC